MTVWLTMLVHLLTLLAARALGLARRSPLLLARLAAACQHLDPANDADGPPTASQLPPQASISQPTPLASLLDPHSHRIQDGIGFPTRPSPPLRAGAGVRG